MADVRLVDRACSQAFNEVNRYYANDELGTGEEKAREVLEDSALPTYHRIRTLVLLGAVVAYVFLISFAVLRG